MASLLENAEGTSGQTCKAMLEFMAAHRPPFVLFENVPELVEAADASNLNYLTAAMHTIGYELGCRILTATDYFMPQCRRRVCGVCVDVDSSGMAQDECKLLVEGAELSLMGNDGLL